MDTSGRWVHLPLLSAELPAGWKVSESAAFVAPSGRSIWVTIGRADDEDAGSLIAHDLDEIRVEFGDPVEQSSSTHRWRGEGDFRSTTLRFDEPAHVRVLAGVVDRGLAMRVTGAWAVDDDNGGTDDLETVLAGIRLLSRPVFEPDPAEGSLEPAPDPGRPPVAPETWTELHTAWSSGQNGERAPTTTTVWSADELATIATILGAASFPTVGNEILAGLTDESLRAVLGATMRSLTARKVVEIAPDGSARVNDDTATTMDVAVFPDLAISVQSGNADGTSTVTFFGVRPDDAVRIDVVASGARECVRVDPHSIATELMSLIGNHANNDGGRETVQLGADALAERWKAMETAWQISTTWRDGGVVSGRVLYAARDTDAHYWISEPDDDDTWTLRPVSMTEVRDEILGCLPGAV